ncbi:MAG: MBL fold metallo-hydrolase [Candidatus Dormibacterales bacterium]
MARISIVKVGLEREVNAYVVACAATRQAVVVDPGLPVEKLAAQVRPFDVRWIVATHGHPGHVAGKDDLKDLTGAETAMQISDAKQFLRSAGRYLLDGDELEFGDFRMRVLLTPGHTQGSLCLLVGNHLFTGDTLLAGGIGREMPGSDLRRQLVSIVTRLLPLPPTTAVYPGHGPVTSIGGEIASNPYLTGVAGA